MGAAPVLIMLAAVGVDYGWQPDGTTSSRGDNIEYIVQISPEQLQQIRSIGEITSTIDPAVQGRVTRIVVKVGNGPLPKDAGRSTVAANAFSPNVSSRGGSDDDLLPIPEIVDSVASHSTSGSSLQDSVTPQTSSLMKPDPQGGFVLPESMQTGAQSAYDQVRSRVNEVANQLDNQARTTIESQANALSQSASDAAARAAGSLQNSLTAPPIPSTNQPATSNNAANNFGGARSTAPVSTDPMSNRDNRWSDQSSRASAGQGPSTDPVADGARTAPWNNNAASGLTPPTFGGAGQSTDPRSISPGFGAPTDFAAPPSTTSALSGAPPRDPADPKWSGYGTSTNFGALPGGLTVPRPDATTTQTQSPLATNAQATTNNPEFRQDASGNWYNSRNQLVNRDGQPIDRYGNRLDASGYPVDIYGRRVDDNNQVIPQSRLAQSTDIRPPYSSVSTPAPTQTPSFGTPYAATAADQFGVPSLNDPSSYLQPGLAQSPYGSNLTTSTLAQQQLAQQQLAQQQQTAQQLAEAQRQLQRYQDRDKAQTRLVGFDDETSSASDLRATAAQLAAKAERDRMAAVEATNSKTKSVAAQPFFNFVLLISLVGNAYLIFETNNLRRKFRNMISSVRSSKVTAQPAA